MDNAGALEYRSTGGEFRESTTPLDRAGDDERTRGNERIYMTEEVENQPEQPKQPHQERRVPSLSASARQQGRAAAGKERLDPKQSHGTRFRKRNKEASHARALKAQAKLWHKRAQRLAPDVPKYSLYMRTSCALSIAVDPPVRNDRVPQAREQFHAWILARVQQQWPSAKMNLHKEKEGAHTDNRLYRLYTGTDKDAFISVAMTMYGTDDQRFILRGASERLDKVQQMTGLDRNTSSAPSGSSGQGSQEIDDGQGIPQTDERRGIPQTNERQGIPQTDERQGMPQTNERQGISQTDERQDPSHGERWRNLLIPFFPDERWREVLPHHVCPAGLEYYMDLKSGKNYARNRDWTRH